MDEFCLEHASNEERNRRARLIRVDEASPQFIEVRDLFHKGWKHPEKSLPYLHAVYKIISPESSVVPFVKYQSSVTTASFWSPFIRSGSQTLLFHGTNRACLLGESEKDLLLCKLPTCSLCTIIRESFDVNKCGHKHKFSRFGTGIYTTACSSKADDYSRNVNPKAHLRVLLLNRVAVGRPYKIRHNAVDLKGPPLGFHSVQGVPGGDLNYEETVVYDNDAIRPGYLLVYGDPPERHKASIKESLRRLFTTPLAS